MFKNILKVKPSYWLLVPAILQATIPWFAFRIRIMFVFALMVLWLAVNFADVVRIFQAKFSRAFRNVLFWFLVYNFLNNVYALVGFGDFSTYNEATISVVQMLFFLVAHYVLVSNKYCELKFLTFWALFGIIVAGLMNLRGVGIEGLEGARALTGTGARELGVERMEMIMDAANIGLGDYRYVYMCAWLFGIMLMVFGMAKTMSLRLLSIIVAIACAISVKMGGLGTPVFLMGISAMLVIGWWILTKRRKIVKILGYALIVAITFYYVAPVVYKPLSVPLRLIGENMSEGSIKARFLLLADAFTGDDNYARERSRLQLISWDTFCSYPILGEGMYHFEYGKKYKNRVGGHSLVLDRLAKSGVMGFIPFILFLYWLGKYYEDITRNRFGGGWLAIPTMFISIFIFSSIANPTFGVPQVMYIILPGIAYLIAVSRNELQSPFRPQYPMFPMPY